MKIVYLSDQLLPQHATDTEQILNMVSAMGSAGAAVELLLPARWDRQGPSCQELAAYYDVEPSFRVSHRRSVFPSIRALEKPGHALAALGSRLPEHDWLYTRNLPTVFLARALGHRAIVWETYRPWPRQNAYLAGLLSSLAADPEGLRLVLHSEYAAQSYRELGFPDEQVLVAHNGWDPRKIEPRMDKIIAREACGLRADDRIVVYAGHISPAKGLDGVLEIARSCPDIRFLLIGSRGTGPIETMAKTLDNVAVHPWLPFRQVVPYLYAADVLLIPPSVRPLTEVGNTVLPIKTFLYMATGRPIFAPDSPDLREVLEPGTSCLVPPDDPRVAAAALRDLLGDRSRCETLGDRARAAAVDRTWRRRAERVLEFLARRP